MPLPRVSCLLGGAMSRSWFKSASAVPTIWACFPRHGGGSPPAATAHFPAPRTSPKSKLIDTVHPVPTHFGTGMDVRGASPAAGGLIKLDRHKSFIMHTYEKRACKPFGMHCYKIIELKVPWNEYLQKKAGVGGRRLSRKSGQCPCCSRFGGGFDGRLGSRWDHTGRGFSPGLRHCLSIFAFPESA